MDLWEANEEFPGIRRFYEDLPSKPRTFLELLARFEHWCTTAKVPTLTADEESQPRIA